MAAERSFQRLLRTLAMLTTVTVPAVAVTTVDATGREHVVSHMTGSTTEPVTGSTTEPVTGSTTVTVTDDMNMMRQLRNAERSERMRAAARRAALAARPSAAYQERASRDLVRRVLTMPKYVRPVPGPVTQWYGYHPGIDIAPGFGTPIVAAHSGVVTFVGWEDGYGMHVEVAQADGYATTYSHMSAWTVTVGQIVTAGQQLGNVGSTGYSTGPHLHFEVHLPGGARMDPAVWLREHGVDV